MVRGFHPEGTNIKRHARLPLADCRYTQQPESRDRYWPVAAIRVELASMAALGCEFNRSISEQITLDTPDSGDERKAELICRLISGVFSSQFGHKRTK